jgi:PKD repeat protein
VDSLEGRIDILEPTLRTTTIVRPRVGTHELTYEATTACGIVTATDSYVVSSNCVPVTIQGFTSPFFPITYGTDYTLSFTLAGDVTGWSLKSSLGNVILPFKGTTGGSLTATYRAFNEAGLDTVTLTAEGPCGTTSKSITITVEHAP